MPAPMPAAVVLIVCKTTLAGAPDVNSAYTGYENREWATEHSMMLCRREEVQLVEQEETSAPQVFNQQQCQRAGISLGVNWDAAHRASAYRFWRVACPVPIVDTRTGEVIAWKLPDCGHRETVICESDSQI